jgi:hypothetical protein
MPAAPPGRFGKVAFDVEERLAGNVALEVGRAAEGGVVERPPAIHEDVVHRCDR